MSAPQVRLCDDERERLVREIRAARWRPTERPGLYIMVFLILINSCSGARVRVCSETAAETVEEAK